MWPRRSLGHRTRRPAGVLGAPRARAARRARRPMTRSSGDYFNERMVNRQLLIWAIATRRQIERWEPLVAANLRAQYVGAPPFPDAFIWEAATEHHFLQIAARNLIRAIDLATPTVPIEPKIRAELIEGRNLHEHWVDNLPVLSVTPRAEQPKHRSGKAFAARNPGRGPYWWLGWTNTEGPMILPNVPAQAVHELVDRVEATVMARDSGLRRFIPPRQPSPWLGEDAGDDRWWPREPAPT
jgi:hypothetical protein